MPSPMRSSLILAERDRASYLQVAGERARPLLAAATVWVYSTVRCGRRLPPDLRAAPPTAVNGRPSH
ncbi:hypothetical protein BURKHO8Y_30194 [Burkholderia sp. 8Y]|nr:hypothetical protein BURKHO8Y_30194 [Burkholderia sp. 8Y]